jgi:hypothetical protein
MATCPTDPIRSALFRLSLDTNYYASVEANPEVLIEDLGVQVDPGLIPPSITLPEPWELLQFAVDMNVTSTDSSQFYDLLASWQS